MKLLNAPSDLPNQFNMTCLHYLEERIGDAMTECLCGKGAIKATITYIETENENVIAKVTFGYDASPKLSTNAGQIKTASELLNR